MWIIITLVPVCSSIYQIHHQFCAEKERLEASDRLYSVRERKWHATQFACFTNLYFGEVYISFEFQGFSLKLELYVLVLFFPLHHGEQDAFTGLNVLWVVFVQYVKIFSLKIEANKFMFVKIIKNAFKLGSLILKEEYTLGEKLLNFRGLIKIKKYFLDSLVS